MSKFARRQGIATNMVQLAMDIANSEGIFKFNYCPITIIVIHFFYPFLTGIMQLFVQVNVDNRHAHDLYKKVGFKVVIPYFLS